MKDEGSNMEGASNTTIQMGGSSTGRLQYRKILLFKIILSWMWVSSSSKHISYKQNVLIHFCLFSQDSSSFMMHLKY